MTARFTTTQTTETATDVRGEIGQATIDPTSIDLDARTLMHWGFEVDLNGINAHEKEAQLVVQAATRRGLNPILVQVLADRHEPAPARTRSFGRLALALAA